jgi:hypothetical protein
LVVEEEEEEEEELEEVPDEVATKLVPEKRVWTRCSAFISRRDDDDEDDDEEEAWSASFICGILSPVRVASLTTAEPRRTTQSQGMTLLAKLAGCLGGGGGCAPPAAFVVVVIIAVGVSCRTIFKEIKSPGTTFFELSLIQL